MFNYNDYRNLTWFNQTVLFTSVDTISVFIPVTVQNTPIGASGLLKVFKIIDNLFMNMMIALEMDFQQPEAP